MSHDTLRPLVTGGSAQANVHQQRLTSVKKDKTGGSTQAKVHQQRLISVKKTRRVEAYKPKSSVKKDKTSGRAQAKVHQQRLTSVKKDKTSGSAQAFLQFTHNSYSLPIIPTGYP